MRAALGVAVVLAIALGRTPAGAWQRTFRYASGLAATGPGGEVVVLGSAPGEWTVFAVAHDGVDGRVRWRRRVDDCRALALDARGDVFLSCIGQREEQGSNHAVVEVVALAADTGAERWRRALPAAPGFASYTSGRSVAAGSAGSAFVSATLDAPGYTSDAVLAKLGDGGDERWRLVLPGAAVTGFALGGGGDAVLAAVTNRAFEATIARVAGATGSPRWRTSAPRGMGVVDVAFAPDGTVALAGSLSAPDFDERRDFAVAVLDGPTGALRWTARVIESPVAGGMASRVAFVDGDVVAVGETRYARVRDSNIAFTVARFDGATGRERWRRTIDGTDPIVVGGGDEARALVVDGAGDLLVGGGLRNVRTCDDAVLVKLDGASGDVRWTRTFDGTAVARRCVDVCYELGQCGEPSRSIVDTDYLGDVEPQGAGGVVVDMSLSQRASGSRRYERRVLVTSELVTGESLTLRAGVHGALDLASRDRRILAPAPGDADAPRTVGATLRLVRADGGGELTLPLEAARWRASRVPGGWRWEFTSPSGPCRRATVTSGGGVRVRCVVESPALPLDGMDAGGIGADLRFGRGARWCLAFDGRVEETRDGGRRFTAGPASAPARCP